MSLGIKEKALANAIMFICKGTHMYIIALSGYCQNFNVTKHFISSVRLNRSR